MKTSYPGPCLLKLTWVFVLLLSGVATAQDATLPGKPTSPSPTYENLSIDWPIQGDENENGTVTVRYRSQGSPDWKKALSLFRVPAGSNCGFQWKNRHSGSLFGLKPDTTYEIELTLADPDGGNQKTILKAATRAWPQTPTQGEVVDVGSLGVALGKLTPGDVLVLREGDYGDINILQSGTLEQPIVIRAEDRHRVTIDGDVRIDGQAHVHLVGLNIHGKVKFNDANNIVVRDCKVQTTGDGIVAYGSKVSTVTIIENSIKGPSQWKESSLGTDGDNRGEGIVLTGDGHVIANNLIEGFRDGISLVEDQGAYNQISIDIYRNDIYRCCDDGIEADFSMGNVRVYENRLTDCFMGISSQPSLGGPTYFVRNEIYNALLQAFKLQRSSVGDIGFHNTVVKSGDAFNVNTEDVWSRAWFCNNLLIGSPGKTYNGYHNGDGKLLYLPSAASSCKLEYNGYGSIGTEQIIGIVGDQKINSAAELAQQSCLRVDLGLFADSLGIPDPLDEHEPQNFSLKRNAIVVDQGKRLHNFNDGFSGAAPDLGAIEYGAKPPNYGPSRPNDDDSEN